MERNYGPVSSCRLYLKSIWRTKCHLYKFYKNEYCTEKDINPVSNAEVYNTIREMKDAKEGRVRHLCRLLNYKYFWQALL